MSDELPEQLREAEPAEETMSVSQEDKPVAKSASPAGEEMAAHTGEARPADPKDADDILTHKLGGESEASRGAKCSRR